MDINHKHEVGQSIKAGFGAGFGAIVGKFLGCFGIVVVLSIMVAMCSGGKNAGSSAGSAKPTGEPLAVTASDLSAAFHENEAKAKLAFDGKPLLVSGVVKDIDLNITDSPVIKLRGSGDQYGMGVNKDGKISDVSANGLSKEDAAALNKGQKIKVLCSSVDEVMGGAQLEGCSIN